jgi:hypothetical protein
MLPTLHTTLRRLLYERGKIDPDEVAVRFARPTRQWLDALTMPTLNLFLYAVEENPDFRNQRPQVKRIGNSATTSFPPARVDLHYMVAAFSSMPEDEHELIWRVLAVLLRHPALPAELLDETVRALDVTLLTRITRLGEGAGALEFWQALEIPPRPCLLYSVTAPLDLDLAVIAPLVLTRNTRFTRRSPEDEAAARGIMRDRTIEVASSLRIGGVLRDAQGAPLAGLTLSIEGRALPPIITSAEGRFTLGPLQPGPLTLRVTRPGAEDRLVPLVIPSESYDVVID